MSDIKQAMVYQLGITKTKCNSCNLNAQPVQIMKIFRLVLLSVFWIFNYCSSQAQQQAMYTQYMFNGLALNPAYAGSHESISLTGLARFQWVGIEGAPRTQTFSVHSPVPGKKIGIGGLFSRDEIGVSSQSSVYLSAAYRIKSDKGTFAMGLQGGIRASDIIYTDLGIDDPNLQRNISGLVPNFGAGFYYYSDKFYLGLSVPTILKSSIQGAITSGGSISATDVPHFFATSGLVVELAPTIKLKPSTLIKYVTGAPMEIDINANLILDDKVWVGLSYRSLDAISFLLDFQVNNQFRFGYAYDYTLTDINRITSGSHEIMINYRLVFEKTRIVTPRYF